MSGLGKVVEDRLDLRLAHFGGVPLVMETRSSRCATRSDRLEKGNDLHNTASWVRR